MTPPDSLTAAEFQAACALLWGDHWRPDAADALGVGLRNVQFWAAEPPARSKPVPPGVARELFAMVAARMADPAEADLMRAAVARHAAQTRILELVIALEIPQDAGHR